MKIKDLSEADRPRERLLSKGAASLSESELIAILIGNGNRQKSAIELSQQLLYACEGSLANLFNTSIERLCATPGIGHGKACSIIAALELGRRFMTESSSVLKRPISTARMAFELIFPQMKGLRHEECWVMFFNNQNYLISRSRITSGGADSTIIDVRKVVRMALDKSASGIILVHNHPSGNPNPSQADVKQTDLMHKALQTCQIALLDHLVVCDDAFYSFSEEKCMSAFK